jgi:hypothetical protein
MKQKDQLYRALLRRAAMLTAALCVAGIGLAWPATDAAAQDRASCVGVRKVGQNGLELYNGCAETITVFWCQDRGSVPCRKYDMMLAEFTPNARWQLPFNGYTRWGACRGERSRASSSDGPSYSCKLR